MTLGISLDTWEMDITPLGIVVLGVAVTARFFRLGPRRCRKSHWRPGTGKLLVVDDDGGHVVALCIGVCAAASPTAATAAGTTAQGRAFATTALGLSTSRHACQGSLGAAVARWHTDMGDLVARCDGTRKLHSRCATDANNAVSFGDAGDGLFDGALGHAHEGRVENARVEVGYQSLDPAGKAHTRGA